MTRATRTCAALLATLLLGVPGAAYERSMTSLTIREAYFLGRRNDDKTAAFLAQYVRRFPLPSRGPHMAEIEVRTPYTQLVLRSQQMLNWSAQQARQQYKPQAERILVRVRIYLTPSYPAHSPTRVPVTGPVQLRNESFWRDFKIRVTQEQAIQPLRTSGQPIYSIGGDFSSLVGAEVELELDADQVASAPLRVEVIAPQGQRVEAQFDLSVLR